MQRDELAGWLHLCLTPGVGNEASRRLLAAFGPPASVMAQTACALGQVVSAAQAQALLCPAPGLPKLLDATWQWLSEPAPGTAQRHIVTLGDPDYPPSLLHMADPPLLLYLLGQVSAWQRRVSAQQAESECIAMVGSRQPSAQGLANARQFAHEFAQAGWCVVSGLALGIDGAAHEGALQGATPDASLATLAVVGTGLDRVYPRQHRDLAHRIAQRGLILSEYPLGTPPLSANFPKRNRLIAGLSQGTLVVEAALKSGSLITARLAAEQGREVYAIPGSIHLAQSRGCHALIRQGAQLVESATEVLQDLRPAQPTSAGPRAAGAPREPSKTIATNDHAVRTQDLFEPKNEILDALGHDPASLDSLMARTGLDLAHLQAQLLTLELDGRVARLPGGLFQQMARA